MEPAFTGWFDGALEKLADADARCLLSVLAGLPPERWPAPAAHGSLVDLAQSHRLHMLLRRGLIEAGPQAPAWTREALAGLEQPARGEEFHFKAISGAARELARSFAAAGIRCVFLKGLALALDAYPTPQLRPVGDLDILVHPDQLGRAAQAVRDLGFAASPANQQTPAALRIEDTFHKELLPGAALELDLHWALVGPHSLLREMRLDVGGFLARSQRRQDDLCVLRPEDALLFAAANLVVHGYSPLGNFYDFKMLAARGPDWQALLERAAECRVRSALSAGLAIAAALFGAEAPPEAARRLVLPRWQRVALGRLLRLKELARRDRPEAHFSQPRVRYLLKVLSHDSLAGVCRILAWLPLGYVRRRRANAGT